MTALVSVIIPTLNEEAAIECCLGQFAALDGRWEAIVADSGSDDRTVELARSSGAVVVEDAPAGRGDAMNAGAARAAGDILLFLHADTLLPAEAYHLIVDALASDNVVATGFRIRMARPEWRFRLLTPLGTLRFRLQRTFFGDQAIAVRRADFDQVGGYREPVLMEDVDLSRRLRRLGKLRLLPANVTTSARRFERGGLLRTVALMSVLQVAYTLGVPAERLNRWYRHVRGGGSAERPPEFVHLAGLQFLDEHDEPVSLAAVGERPVLLVFLRWLG